MLDRVIVFAPKIERLGLEKLNIMKDCIFFCTQIQEFCNDFASEFLYLVIHRKHGLIVSEVEHFNENLLIVHSSDKSIKTIKIDDLDIEQIYKIESIYNIYN